MVTPEQAALLARFYKALADRPLEPEDAFYEPFVRDRALAHAEDPIAELVNRIEWSESQSVSLLTGMRGNGKSTELRRLRRDLKTAGCEVVLCNAHDYLNLNSPVEISDFLFSVMGALDELVKSELHVDPPRETYLDRVASWPKSEVTFKEIGFSGDGLALKASLREDPTFRRRVQEHMRGRVAKIRAEAHDFATEVVDAIRRSRGDPDRKVVFILDSFEQLRGSGSEGADEVYRSVEKLFSGHADALQIPILHVVYTIPPYLTPLAPGLAARLGGGVVYSLPSVHVRTRTGDPDTRGMQVMEGIIARRSKHWQQILSEQQLERFAQASGGDIRDFFRLIRESLVMTRNGTDGLPVSDGVIEQTESLLRGEMLPIADNDKAWLREIAGSKEARLPSIEELPRLARFFDTKLVLNYRNGESWYDVHPLLAGHLES